MTILVFLAAPIPSAPASFAEEIDPHASAVGIDPRVLVSSTFTGDPRSYEVSSFPLGGFPLQGNDFVILSTGKAADAYRPDLNNSELLGKGGTWDDISTIMMGRAENGTWDPVQWRLTLRPPAWARSFAFDFAFFTEEWPEFYGSPYNDALIVEIGGSDIQADRYGQVLAPNNITVNRNGMPISVNVGFGLDPEIPNPNTGTTYDGTTGLVTTMAPIPERAQEFTIIVTLFDVADPLVDSAVFLDGFRFSKEAIDEAMTIPRNPGREENADLPTRAKITAGGYIGIGQNEDNFGGNLLMMHDSVRGNWTHSSMTGDRFQSLNIDSVSFTTVEGPNAGMPAAPANAAIFSGVGALNGLPGYSFTVWLTDRGEPGTMDSYGIEVKDSLGVLVLAESGTLIGGNIQIHPPGPH